MNEIIYSNDWRKFTSRSNVLWLHYLLVHLCERINYPRRSLPSNERMKYMHETVLPAVFDCGKYINNNLSIKKKNFWRGRGVKIKSLSD